MIRKSAVIAGVARKNCAFVAQLGFTKSYKVQGIKRRTSDFRPDLIDHIYKENMTRMIEAAAQVDAS